MAVMQTYQGFTERCNNEDTDGARKLTKQTQKSRKKSSHLERRTSLYRLILPEEGRVEGVEGVGYELHYPWWLK